MFSAFQTFGRLGAGGLPFSERALWPLGAASPGLWIDPAYTPSEFQDSAGTTQLSTVGTVLDSSNPVGLVLDRKAVEPFGPEMVTNGDASDGLAGWSAFNGASPSVSGGRLVVTSTASGICGIERTITGLEVGQTYRFYGKARRTAGGASAYVTLYTVALGFIENATNSVTLGVETSGAYYYKATATSVVVRLQLLTPAAAGDVGEFDDISFKKLNGIHLSQSTSAARPVASARKNLLVGTATLSTQSVTVTAIPHTITFSGGGTVTASDAYVGALTNGQTFTPSAGTLTLTVSGSVTSAQLEHGSAATTYQAVVSASDYTASGFPVYTKFDGTDDALSSATFSAGTLTSSMDCLIALRRDSTSNTVVGLYNAVADATKYFGMAESGSGSGCVGSGAGTPTVWVDGVQLTGGTAVTRGTLHTALTAGAWHIVEFRGLDLSTWTAVGHGLYTSYVRNGALGDIQLFASGQDANRDKARARMAAYFGVTLP